MSAELTALNELAVNYRNSLIRLSPTSQAVLYYATAYLIKRSNWIDRTNPLDTVSDVDWDTISAYVDGLLYEVKTPMIGYIVPFVTIDPPPNVLPCDGSIYLKDDYPVLYDVIAPIFIIDDEHFMVPDLRGRTIIAAGSGAGLSNRNVGDTGGEEEHTLSTGEIPSHAHSVQRTTTTLAVEPGEIAVLSPIPIIPDYTGNEGGGYPHNNMQPFYALNYGVVAS